ncbi:MAG: hypothetical protein ACTSO7_03685 [Candidatus Heimdallarchaeota archaeon]
MRYYTGKIVDDLFTSQEEYNINDNRIYISVKTIVPIVTAKPALPVVFP